MVTLSEAFPSRFLKASDLQGGPVVGTIKLAELEKIKGYDGREQAKIVIYFARALKPLVLNRTNAESIMDISGADDTESWPGTKIELYTIPVTFNGKTSDGIRIRRPDAPKPKKAAPPPQTLGAEMNDEIPSFGK
jgi:hypothetical protein